MYVPLARLLAQNVSTSLPVHAQQRRERFRSRGTGVDEETRSSRCPRNEFKVTPPADRHDAILTAIHAENGDGVIVVVHDSESSSVR